MTQTQAPSNTTETEIGGPLFPEIGTWDDDSSELGLIVPDHSDDNLSTKGLILPADEVIVPDDVIMPGELLIVRGDGSTEIHEIPEAPVTPELVIIEAEIVTPTKA